MLSALIYRQETVVSNSFSDVLRMRSNVMYARAPLHKQKLGVIIKLWWYYVRSVVTVHTHASYYAILQ